MRRTTFPPRRDRRLAACALLGSAALLAAQALYARTIAPPFLTSNFDNPLTINNQYLPLVPGTTFVYRSDGPDGCEETRVTVTSGVKHVAAGIDARVVRDVVSVGATCTGPMTVIEETDDWYAQDDFGNVWYVGEDTKECDENGCVQGHGSWEAGGDFFNEGHLGVAGIIMLAEPRKGDNYQQEFYEDHAEDVGAVVGTDVTVTLRRSDARQPKVFHHCVTTKERSTLEPGSVAHKFYCPTIGLVAEQDLSRGPARAELIDPGALALEFRRPR